MSTRSQMVEPSMAALLNMVQLLKENYPFLAKDVAKMTAFLEHLRNGLSRHMAAALVGLDPWDVKGAYETIPCFSVLCDQATATCALKLTDKVMATEDAKVAIRALESIDPGQWGPRQKVDHTTGGQPMGLLALGTITDDDLDARIAAAEGRAAAAKLPEES